MKFFKRSSRFIGVDEIEMLLVFSKMNAELVNELITNKRIDKLCSIMSTLSLQNLRFRNRTMRKSIDLQESIAAAIELHRTLLQNSIRGKDSEYID